MRRRVLVGTASAVLLAFGSVALHAQEGQRPTVGFVNLPGSSNPVSLDSIASRYPVAAPRSAVFAAARAALADLEIPVTAADSAHGILLNRSLVKMHRLGKYRLSQILDCGGNITGRVADQFRLTIAVAAMVDSTGPADSFLRVGLTAGAESVDGASKPPVACATTGVLEERAAALTREHLQRGGAAPKR